MNKRKQKSLVWDYFESLAENKSSCSYCKDSITSTAARLKYHLVNACKLCSENIKSQLKYEGNGSKELKTKHEFEEPRPGSSQSVSSFSTLSSFIDTMNVADVNEIHTLVARVLYVNSLSFALVENKTFVELSGSYDRRIDY